MRILTRTISGLLVATLAFPAYAQVTDQVMDRLKTKDLVIVAGDTLPPQMQALKEGRSHAQIGQRPFEMGYRAPSVMIDLIDGKDVEDPIFTGLDECTADNIFIVRDGVVITPPTEAGILDGITRSVILRLCRREGIPCEERNLVRFDLYSADECFMTGTAAEVIGVTSIDKRVIGGGGVGPVTRRLKDLFHRYARGQDQGLTERMGADTEAMAEN